MFFKPALHFSFFLFCLSFLISKSASAHVLDKVILSSDDELRIRQGASSISSHECSIFNPDLWGKNLPKNSSVRSWMSPVRDQHQRGTCSVFATVSLLEFGNAHRYSEQCLAALNTYEDAGTILERVEWAINKGVFLNKDCPYADSRDQLPEDLSERTLYRQRGLMTAYHSSCEDSIQFIRKNIASGIPVGVGVLVIDLPTWFNKQDRRPLEVPANMEFLIDKYCKKLASNSKLECEGHAIAITGYDDDLELLTFKNSWGSDWKDSGYGQITYEYFRRLHSPGSMVALHPEEPTPVQNEYKFIKSMYNKHLKRNPELEGMRYWFSQLGKHGDKGRIENEIADSPEARNIYIKGIYKKWLLRDPEPAGMAYWINQLNQHGDRGKIERSIADSEEGRRVYATSVYKNLFGPRPDPEGLAYWINQLNLDGDRIKIGKLMADNEDKRAYIASLYHRFLKRAPEHEGMTYWLKQLNQHGDQKKIERSIEDSEEGRKVYIAGLYHRFLGRPPEPEGMAYWMAQLSRHGDRSKIEDGIANSEEARKRRGR